MRRIAELPLWIGTARDARDIRGVLDLGIEAVVDLAVDEPPVLTTRELVYLRFPLVDGEGNPAWLLRLAAKTVARLLAAGVPTLVACSAGASRSPVIAAMAMAKREGIQPEDALTRVGHGDVSPALWREVVTANNGATGGRHEPSRQDPPQGVGRTQ